MTFVDGDDVIHPDMYRYLMAELLENDDTDIIVCGVADRYGKEIKHQQMGTISSRYEEVSHIDGVLRIAAKYLQSFPCGFFEEYRKRIKSVIPNSYLVEILNMRKRTKLFVLRHFPFLFKWVYKVLPAW